MQLFTNTSEYMIYVYVYMRERERERQGWGRDGIIKQIRQNVSD